MRWVWMWVYLWSAQLTVVEASETVIYCDDTDRTVYGWVDDSNGVALEVELENIRQSEGYQAKCATELKTAPLATRPLGLFPQVASDGTVSAVPDPQLVQLKSELATKTSGLQVALGLTDQQIADLKAVLSR